MCRGLAGFCLAFKTQALLGLSTRREQRRTIPVQPSWTYGNPEEGGTALPTQGQPAEHQATAGPERMVPQLRAGECLFHFGGQGWDITEGGCHLSPQKAVDRKWAVA